MVHIKTGALKLRSFAYFAAFAFVFFALLSSSGPAAQAILDGLKISALVLVPSLFPLSVVSGMIVRLKIAEPLCAYLGKPFKKMFGVSENAVLAFLIGLAGGYPLGILAATDMYKNARISAHDLKKLSCFCSNCSPSFIFGVAAPHLSAHSPVLDTSKTALLLLGAHILSALVSGLVFSEFAAESKGAVQNFPKSPEHKAFTFTSALTESVESSAIAMLRLTAYISLFYMLNRILLSFIMINFIKNLTGLKSIFVLLSGVLEFSTGVLSLGAGRGDFALCAFFISFGGLCVAMQSASILRETGIKIRYYIFSKLFQGAAAYIFVYIALSLL